MNLRHVSQLTLATLLALWLIGTSSPAHAVFGVGDEVLIQRCTRANSNSSNSKPPRSPISRSSYQYMVKNTTGGGAGVWQSNQNLLTNLGEI